MSTQKQSRLTGTAFGDGEPDIEPRDDPPTKCQRRGGAYDWVRNRLDYLQELPAPGTEWDRRDLDGGAQVVFETLRRQTDYGIIEKQRTDEIRRDSEGDESESVRERYAVYKTDPEWWAFIKGMRQQRSEFDACGHSAGVHHAENPEGERKYTCGNEYCGELFTREEVTEAMNR